MLKRTKISTLIIFGGILILSIIGLIYIFKETALLSIINGNEDTTPGFGVLFIGLILLGDIGWLITSLVVIIITIKEPIKEKNYITNESSLISNAKSDNKYCSNCGQKLDKDAKFCKHCGKEVK